MTTTLNGEVISSKAEVIRQSIPPQGTIPRCKHSHYAPDGDAFHCYLCHPIRPTFSTEFVVPVDSSTPLNGKDALHANRTQPGCCPKCGSRIHYDEGKEWRCVECDTKYKAPHKHAWKLGGSTTPDGWGTHQQLEPVAK